MLSTELHKALLELEMANRATKEYKRDSDVKSEQQSIIEESKSGEA